MNSKKKTFPPKKHKKENSAKYACNEKKNDEHASKNYGKFSLNCCCSGT
jgi:hypothetical protein